MNYEPGISWLKIVTQGGVKRNVFFSVHRGDGPNLPHNLLSCLINYSDLGNGGRWGTLRLSVLSRHLENTHKVTI